MVHPKSPMPVSTDNTAVNGTVSGRAKQKIYRAIDMRFYWVWNRIVKIISKYS